MTSNLRCKKTFGVYKDITIGKEYFAIDTITIPEFGDIKGAIYYLIKNDSNNIQSYESGCFINIKEERRKKLKKINK